MISSRAPLVCVVATLAAIGCAPDAFVETSDFGENRGGLRMFEHVPETKEGALVVMLHGCSQSHDAARTSGLTALADERGFVVVAPEQAAFNNPQLCFNWFEAGDTTRDEGEAHSIREMITSASDRHDIDLARVFVTGLSAGGAMSAVLMAAYPEVVAAGAVIAGGPFGCARSLVDATGCMAGATELSRDAWADRVRDATDHEGPWPRLLVMQGRDDLVVSPSNADHLVAQWTALHEVDDAATTRTTSDTDVGEATHERFGAEGDERVERILIDGLGHALPIVPSQGCGEDAAFQRDIDLCAVEVIADFFRL